MDCSWTKGAKIYKGGTEKICNPRGCPITDCVDGEKVCYETMPCRPADWPIPLFHCENISGSGFYACQLSGAACFWCVNDDSEEVKDKHMVQNDSCSE
jgi:hypothetical protein